MHETTETNLGAFRDVPFMGVIFVVHEAMKRGFVNGHPDWSNLGQGQPEVGPMESRLSESPTSISSPRTMLTGLSKAFPSCATPWRRTTTVSTAKA